MSATGTATNATCWSGVVQEATLRRGRFLETVDLPGRSGALAQKRVRIYRDERRRRGLEVDRSRADRQNDR